MLKSIGAILAGFITVFILSIVTDMILEGIGIFPGVNHPELYTSWMLLVALIYRSFYAVIGGYVTAFLAKKKPMKLVWILGIIGFAFATLGAFVNTGKSAEWYPIMLVVLTIPSVWLGGWIRTKKK